MLYMKDVSKTYGLRPVLNGINININKAEVFVLFGHNGAGKTTMLKIAAGIMSPTSGKVVYEDDTLRKGGIFYLGHKNSLYTELTVLENIRFFLSLRNVAGAAVRDTLSEFGLWQRRNAPVKSLSQGMKRRLALMKAILSGARLIVLDEPFSGLDLRWKDTVLEWLLALSAEGRSLLVATHLVQEGCQIADRVGLLERGELTVMHEKSQIDDALIQERLKHEVCK